MNATGSATAVLRSTSPAAGRDRLPAGRRVVLVHDRLRPEEELLFAAFEELGVELERIYAPRLALDLERLPQADVVLLRCVSQTRCMALAHVYEAAGAVAVNSAAVIQTCGDKLATSAALVAAGIPTPRTGVAFDETGVLELCEQFGWPVVMKPVVGSWGRMVVRLSDRDAVAAVLAHRESLGGPQHRIHYVQEYVEKPGRDIRAFVVGNEVICAIYRTSDDWITNTARGAVASNCPVTPELEELALRAAAAVGGGMLAIDLLEASGGLQVIEVNHTMEFRNSIRTTGVDIPARMAGYVRSLLPVQPHPAVAAGSR